MKTTNKENIFESSQRVMMHFSTKLTKSEKNQYSILNADRKELSITNSIPSENIHQELKGNKNILRQRKTKRNCHQQSYSQRMAKSSSQNQKEMITEVGLQLQKEKRQNEHSPREFLYDHLMYSMYRKQTILIFKWGE